MIRLKLKELMADYEFKNNCRLSVVDLAEATGIHRATLSKIRTVRGYNVTTDNLDRLCEFFKCQLEDLAEFVPDKDLSDKN